MSTRTAGLSKGRVRLDHQRAESIVNFRTATVLDIPLLSELSRVIWHQHYPSIISREQIDCMLARMYAPEVIERELAEGVEWRIIEVEGKPSGYLAVGMAGPTECKLHKLYLLPELHGCGIGRRCLDAAAAYARSHGAVTLELMVNRANDKALRAYRAYGFEVAESVDWEFAPGFMLNDYRMRLAL